MTRCLRVLGVLVALAGGGLALASCGIPTQDAAIPVSAGDIQPTLPVAPQTVSPCTRGCQNVDVFFVVNGHLRPISRVVPAPPEVRTVIGALLGGPSATERATGIETALASTIRLRSIQETGPKKTVTLNFSGGFGTLSGTKWVLGVAQVVYTVSHIMPGAGVIFEIDGAQSEVPLETGRLWTGAVHESQYTTLLTTTVPTPATTP